jgi:hypothetical protein
MRDIVIRQPVVNLNRAWDEPHLRFNTLTGEVWLGKFWWVEDDPVAYVLLLLTLKPDMTATVRVRGYLTKKALSDNPKVRDDAQFDIDIGAFQ